MAEGELMEISYTLLIALGGILLLGLAADFIGQRTFLPRVTTILVFGALIGPHMLDLIPQILISNFSIIAQLALTMIGFLLGERLAVNELKNIGRAALVVSAVTASVTALIVGFGLWLTGTTLVLAILLGCIASATAPAAAVDVAFEANSDSAFSQRLLAIIALDDIWALLLFSVALSFGLALATAGDTTTPLMFAAREIAGALILGMALGFPASYLTGRIKPGQPMLTEALGIIFLCAGLAIWLEVSFLLTAMTMGIVVANCARHHDQPFRAIEGLEWPLLAIFFVLAGASLDLVSIKSIGIIGSVYIACRIAGKVLGTWLGGAACGLSFKERGWTGLAMLPQAGAAMGMALVASDRFPEHRQLLLSVVIGSTVLFELVGPVLTRMALSKFSANGSD